MGQSFQSTAWTIGGEFPMQRSYQDILSEWRLLHALNILLEADGNLHFVIDMTLFKWAAIISSTSREILYFGPMV